MRILGMTILLGLSLGAWPAPLHAQVPGEAEKAVRQDTIVALSLDEAVRRALNQSEEIRLARSQMQLAEAQVAITRSQALPQINANLGYTRTFASPFDFGGTEEVPDAFANLPFGRENAFVATISGSQILYSGGRVGSALEIARSFREATRLNLVEETAEIELQVRSAYYQALLARAVEQATDAALAQAEAFLEHERLRLRAGRASELEVLRAEVARDNLRPQLVQARNAAEIALLNVKRLTDVPMSQPVALTSELEVPSRDELADVRLEPEVLTAQRAAILAAAQQVEIREEQVDIARGAFLPNVVLQTNYGRQLYPSSAFDFDSDWRTDWTATLGVQLPIFTGGRRGAEVAQARVELDRARLQLAQLEDAVQLQYQQALGEKQRASEAISARQTTVQVAQRVYDLTVLRYNQGLATQLEVNDARLALLQARTNLAQAITDYHLADAGVTRAVADAGAGAPTRPAEIPDAQPAPPPAGASRPGPPAPTVPPAPPGPDLH